MRNNPRLCINMTELTNKITSHDLDGISDVIASNPELIDVPSNGWLPIVWARKTDNFVTLARFLRCIEVQLEDEDYNVLLNKYVKLLGSDEYQSLTMQAVAKKIWETLYEGSNLKVGRFKRQLIPGGHNQELDLKFLIEILGYSTKDSFVNAFKNE